MERKMLSTFIQLRYDAITTLEQPDDFDEYKGEGLFIDVQRK